MGRAGSERLGQRGLVGRQVLNHLGLTPSLHTREEETEYGLSHDGARGSIEVHDNSFLPEETCAVAGVEQHTDAISDESEGQQQPRRVVEERVGEARDERRGRGRGRAAVERTIRKVPAHPTHGREHER